MFENIKPFKINSSEVNIWFTSDLHFNHNNILQFAERPWNTVEEMNNALIENWNSAVGEDDIVFDLGDFAFAPSWMWKKILSLLKGRHILIVGNHDQSRYPGEYIMSLFERVENQMLLSIDSRKVYLNHYPFLCYAGTYRNKDDAVIQLFGHVHSKQNTKGKDKDRLQYLFPYQYDVGVDNNDYKPVSWQQIKEIINKQING